MFDLFNRMNKKRIAFTAVSGLLAAFSIAVGILSGTSGFRTDLADAAGQSYTKDTKNAFILDFPESYQPYLYKIKEAYPNAVFVKYDTKLDWDEAFEKDNLMYYSRQMVLNTSDYPSSWKDSTFWKESFDWEKNDWVMQTTVEGDIPCVQASKEVVEYFFDPRTYLNPQYIFAFETQDFNKGTQTVKGVEAVMKGTFMETGKKTIYAYDCFGTQKNAMSYAQAVYNIGQSTGVSPYLIATRMRQEQGVNGTSPLISGKVSGYEGLYNYLNINAAGPTTEEIIRTGMVEAINGSDFDQDIGTPNLSWTSPYLAIWGGAIKLKGNYIGQGRNNLYLQKFDVVQRYTSSGYAYRDYYGYEGNLMGAYSQGKILYNSYVNNNLITKYDSGNVYSEAAFVFEIPVYKNMPESACVRPTNDGNPNNRVSDIQINSGLVSIGTFDMDTLTYSAVVPSVIEDIKLSVSLFAKTSTVKINGKTIGKVGTKERIATVALQNGDNTITIQVTAENGDQRYYSVVVHKPALAATSTNVPVLSGKVFYPSDKKRIIIEKDVLVKDLLSDLSVQNGSFRIIHKDMTPVSTTGYCDDEMEIHVYNKDGILCKIYALRFAISDSNVYVSSVLNAKGGQTITWTKMDGVDGYYIYRKTNSGQYEMVATNIGADQNSVSIMEGYVSGRTYTYYVKAYQDRTLSAMSNECACVYIPPVGIKSITRTTDGIKLTWNTTVFSDSYEIWRKASKGSWIMLATVSGSASNTYEDKSYMVSGETYTYTVRTVSGNVKSVFKGYSTDIICMKAPVITSVKNNADSQTVTWDAVDHAEYYYVYRKINQGSYSLVATVNTNSYKNTFAKVSGNTYSYVIRSYGKGVTSASSNVSSLMFLGDASITGSNWNVNKGVKLTWKTVAGASSYVIYRQDSQWVKVATVSGQNTYTDTGIDVNKTSTLYSIRAINGTSMSMFNLSSMRVIKPGKVNVSLKNTADGIVLSWKAVAADGYDIYRKNAAGSYAKIASVNGSTTQYTDLAAKTFEGRMFDYVVQPKIGVNLGKGTTVKTVRFAPMAIGWAANKNAGCISTSWPPSEYASGYEICYKTGTNSTSITIGPSERVTLTGLKKGSTYQVYIRPFKVVDGVTYYGSWGAAKTVTVTK